MAIDEKYWRGVLSRRKRSVWSYILRAALLVASLFYAIGAYWVLLLYRLGLKKTESVDAPVISIGNITTGGTGKTPVVSWTVRHLAANGYRPAIVTRGYRAVDGYSDEAAFLEQQTNCKSYIGSDRAASAWRAIADGANCIVMDDGFQHRRLDRDLNIALIDAINPFGYGFLLPRGLLREPPSVLKQADLIILTRCDLIDADRLAAVRKKLSKYSDAEILESQMAPVSLRMPDGTREPVELLSGKSLLVFCGIGNPEGFYQMLEVAGAALTKKRSLNDHYDYSEADMAELEKLAAHHKVDMMVTTAKDAIKIDKLKTGVQYAVLEIDLKFAAGHQQKMLDAMMETCRAKVK